jgi:hypothetical protein
MDTIEVELSGEIEHGKPLLIAPEPVALPPEIVEPDELVYRVRRAPGFRKGDILVVQPRNRAMTGELVLGVLGGRVYVGHWWRKHGLKQLRVEGGETLEGVVIAGAINQIVRPT